MARRILVADDSPAARLFLKSCVPKDQAFETVEAVDGQDAIEKFREDPPDITFLDLTMPRLDGYDALAEMRKIDPAAIVIVLSSNIQKRSIEKVMAAGAYAFVNKPPTPEKIADVLKRVQQEHWKEG